MTAPRYNPQDATLRNIRAVKARVAGLLLRIRVLERDVRWLKRLHNSRGKPSVDD